MTIFRPILSAIVLVSVGSLAHADAINSTPGLLYHLDASQGVTADPTTNSVSAWTDQSPNGYVFAQGNTAQQPTYIASSPTFHNQPAIQFNGIADYAKESGLTLNQDVGTAQTVFIVESITSNNGLDGIWGQNGNDTGIRRNSDSAWQYNTTAGHGNINDYPTSIFINGHPTPNQANDGVGVVLTAFGNADFSATGLGSYFDCCGAGARPFGGQIAEVVVYSGTLTPAQQIAIQDELYSRNFTPEPGSLVLLGLSAVGLFVVGRRCRKA